MVTQSGMACIKGNIQVICLVRWPIVLPTIEASWNEGSKSLASMRWSHRANAYCIATSGSERVSGDFAKKGEPITISICSVCKRNGD